MDVRGAFLGLSRITSLNRIILLNLSESRQTVVGSWRLSTARWSCERDVSRDACSSHLTHSCWWYEGRISRQKLRNSEKRCMSTFECAINRHKKVTSELESPPISFIEKRTLLLTHSTTFYIFSSLRHLFEFIHNSLLQENEIHDLFEFCILLYNFFFLHSFPFPFLHIAACLPAIACHITFKYEKSKRDSLAWILF